MARCGNLTNHLRGNSFSWIQPSLRTILRLHRKGGGL